MNNEEDLTHKEKQMFNSLSRQAAHDRVLEGRIVDQLRKERLITTHSSKMKMTLRWAALVVFAIGLFLFGAYYSSALTEGDNYNYILLLSNSKQQFTNDPIDRFEEYGRWSKGIQKQGITITGEKLSTSKVTIGAIENTGSDFSGFFLLSVSSEAEAVRLASTCPHVKYGGAIEIRKIVIQ